MNRDGREGLKRNGVGRLKKDEGLGGLKRVGRQVEEGWG